MGANAGGPRRDAGHFSLIHRQPVVLHTADWEIFDQSGALWVVLEALPERPAYLLVSPSWTLDDEYTGAHIRSAVDAVRERFEFVDVTVMATTAADVEVLAGIGLAALHCSQNALVREDFFFPIPGRQPRFDAIYDAKWADYKRHQLAAGVASLALIAFPHPSACTFEYFQKTLPAVQHAKWFTKPWLADPPYLSAAEVNAAYNQARIGLCLSAVEGPNFASIQYLLAGLPVVTSTNEGGRDEFLSWTTARWVDADAGADGVAEAVAELVNLDIDPLAVRREVLWKVGEHRSRLRTWIRTVIDGDGGNPGWWQVGWPPDLPNKLTEFEVPAAEVLRHTADPEDATVPSAARPRIVLTKEELGRFERDGFLVVDRPLVTPEQVQEVRALLDELLAHFDQLGRDVAYDLGDVKIHEGPQQIPEVSRTLQLDARLGESAAFARCQEVAHQLLTGRAFCNFDHAIFKPPSAESSDSVVGWHQDLAYAPELEGSDEVHIWLALQDVDETNGCMHYVPASAVPGLLPHALRGELAHALVTEAVDPETAVACPIAAGMATIHRPATPHYTGPNRSDRTRVAWILHFVDDGD